MTDHDDITHAFGRLSTLEVPRELDLESVRAAGRHRLVRRRLITGAGSIGTAAAAVAAIAMLSGAVLGGADGGAPATGGGPSGGPSQSTPTPTTQPTGKAPIKPPVPGQQRGGDPLSRWLDAWDETLKARGVNFGPGRSSGTDYNRGQVETYGSVINGRSVGYEAFLATTFPDAVAEARRNPCAIKPFPKDGTGGKCEQHGSYWVKTYDDSNQGRTVLVRVVTDRADVVLAQSVGFPYYRFSISDSNHLLPWSGRDPVDGEAPSKHVRLPALSRMPLTTEQLATVARQLAEAAPQSS